MDRTSKAVHRLWGSLGKNGELNSAPRFADELEAHCSGSLDLCVPSVSKWSYGRQLEHLYLATHWTFDRLDESMTGANASEKMNLLGMTFLTAGFIPRGLFPTIPPLETQGGTMEIIDPLRQRLYKRLDNVRWSLKEILACHGRSKHPRMTYLAARHWMRFLDVHHRHHLAIIRDIVAAAEQSPAQAGAPLESRP